MQQQLQLATHETPSAQDALEVIPVDAAAKLLSRTAQVDDARRRTLLQLGQQQLSQEHGAKVIGPERDLHFSSYL